MKNRVENLYEKSDSRQRVFDDEGDSCKNSTNNKT